LRATIENALIRAALKGGPGSGNWGHTSLRRVGKGPGGSDPGGGLTTIGADPESAPGERIVASEQFRRGRTAFPQYAFPMGTRAELASEMEEIRRHARVERREYGFGVTVRGQIVARDTPGTTKSLDTTPIMEAGANTVVHVHPNSTSFSDGDMVFFLSDERAHHIMIVGVDGTIYRASKTDKTPGPGQIMPVSEIRAAFGDWQPTADLLSYQPRMAAQKVQANYTDLWKRHAETQRRRWNEGQITKPEAIRACAHATMIDFSEKYGLDYLVAEVGSARH